MNIFARFQQWQMQRYYDRVLGYDPSKAFGISIIMSALCNTRKHFNEPEWQPKTANYNGRIISWEPKSMDAMKEKQE